MIDRYGIRRLLLFLSGLGVLTGIVIAAASRFVLPFRFRLAHVVVELPRDHRALAGTTIAFVTDTHIGPHFTRDHIAPVVSMLERVKPDIILFGGDYISESPRYMEHVAPVIGAIARTARDGSWGILGNHDLSNIRHRIVGPLEAEGVRMLSNDAACVTLSGGQLWIAGLDDAILGKPDLDATFSQIPPGAMTILLWHEPDLAEDAARYAPHLQLSGHSHGGQVRLPFLGELSAPVLGRRFVQGRYQIGEMILYVSNGVGMYRPPVRFNCPPEVTLIHLVE
ncbi:MAG TPA: metallophosphoesterase [Thermomicrobiales bacterium]|nr:metallophosphoesterase [Thermomicrobiales bacterium]